MLPSGTHLALLHGLLGNDLMEFQIDRYASNFLECVEQFVSDARVDRDARVVTFRDREITVGAFPISIDVERFEAMAARPDSLARVATLRSRYARRSERAARSAKVSDSSPAATATRAGCCSACSAKADTSVGDEWRPLAPSLCDE